MFILKHPDGSAFTSLQGTEYEAKVTQLMDLGFGREAVIRALTLANGNVEQAAGFLFSG